MSFGSWIKEVRLKRGWDLRTVASAARLNQSSLSRAENDTLSPTLDTAIRILKALKLTKLEFLQVVTDSANPEIWQDLSSKVVPKVGPTEDEVRRFSGIPANPTAKKREFLMRWLHKIDQRLVPEKIGTSGAFRILADYFEPEYEIYKGEEFFNWVTTKRLLTPYSSPLYNFKLKYPDRMKATMLLENYFTGGAVIPEDVQAYLAQLPSDRYLSSKETSMKQAIAREMWHPEAFKKVKLADLMKLDNIIGGRGGIPILSVKAVEQDLSIPLGEAETVKYRGRLSLSYEFIFMSRWVQCLGFSVTEWLQEAHEASEEQVFSPKKDASTDSSEFFNKRIGEY